MVHGKQNSQSKNLKFLIHNYTLKYLAISEEKTSFQDYSVLKPFKSHKNKEPLIYRVQSF